MMASTQLGFRIQIEATNSHALDPAQKKKKNIRNKTFNVTKLLKEDRHNYEEQHVSQVGK